MQKVPDPRSSGEVRVYECGLQGGGEKNCTNSHKKKNSFFVSVSSIFFHRPLGLRMLARVGVNLGWY